MKKDDEADNITAVWIIFLIMVPWSFTVITLFDWIFE